MVLVGIISAIARAAPIIKTVAAKVAPVVQKVVAPIVSGVSGLLSSVKAAPAPVKAVVESKAASFVSKGAALGSVAVGSHVAGGAEVGKIATGSAIAAAGAGTPAGLLVGGTALFKSYQDALKHVPPSQITGTPNGASNIPASSSPQNTIVQILPAPSLIEPKETLVQVKEPDEVIPAPVVTSLEAEVAKLKKDIKELGERRVSGVSVEDAAKVAAGVGLAAGGFAVAAKVRKVKSKSKPKKKTATRKVPAKAAKRKRKSRVRTKKYGGKKLKFGSPAWRKKYMKPKAKKKKAPKKKKKGMKGSGSYYEIEAQSHGLRVPSGHKIEKVGTEAQYNAAGGKKVLHDSRGRPYIKLESGMHRYIKRSKK